MTPQTAPQRLDAKKFLRYPFSQFPEWAQTNHAKEEYMKEQIAITLNVRVEQIHVFSYALSHDQQRGTMTVWNPLLITTAR